MAVDKFEEQKRQIQKLLDYLGWSDATYVALDDESNPVIRSIVGEGHFDYATLRLAEGTVRYHESRRQLGDPKGWITIPGNDAFWDVAVSCLARLATEKARKTRADQQRAREHALERSELHEMFFEAGLDTRLMTLR